MLFKSLATAALAASAFAAPLQHQHHQHQERDVVTKVVVVTAGGEVSSVPTTVPEAPSGSSSSAPSGSDSSVPQPSSSGSFSGGAKGITYTPYSNSGGCKSAQEVASDLKQLSGYEIIRIYGVDCDQVSSVLAGKAAGQKVFAGIFNMNSISSDVQTLASAVKAAPGGWDNIHTVSIGNELVNSGQANAGQVAGYVAEGKSALKAAGYSGPVVSVDTFIAVMNNPALCEHSDYIAVNAHPFFDGGIAANNAGKWVLDQIQNVALTCGSKSVLITETGWPHQGQNNRDAVPSKSNQQAAISDIKSKCGDDVLLFSGFDEAWKADGAYNVEKYWGFLSN
ncbi:glycoside hydrolase family 17 protein [Suhomyces tanzawaensis NRRL Y-17324]|uniref:Glycoside hydrolase family 17 protein n=1 Tax=Suhomyces tanzawaensis NRRL Y-17324 TaxID=984487 RepID=A0A1E4SSD1_9ASCO|nr:glycoside hydrolase family 17 protein [Suhomyces tanzawaensis NRRL Y-17324]ODV82423.1 glycoside hydrolase family 17 protein [Suhomyces tanzawaensis NRRL Y-17324]